MHDLKNLTVDQLITSLRTATAQADPEAIQILICQELSERMDNTDVRRQVLMALVASVNAMTQAEDRGNQAVRAHRN